MSDRLARIRNCRKAPMLPSRLAAVLVGAILLLSVACGGGHGGGGNPAAPSSPGTSGNPPTFNNEGGLFPGSHPAPIVVGGTVLVYQNSGAPGAAVQTSANGVAFAPTPATYPAGISRTIVLTLDGRYRMYYFADGTTVDVSSAVSSDGLNWTVEPGTRYSDPGIGAIRAITLPTGGYRLYYPNGVGVTGAVSGDGLTFTSEGPATITPSDSTYSIGPSAAAYLNGQFHMVLTRTPSSTGVSELWHAVSVDGRLWTMDRSALAINPGIPLNQPAWGILGSTYRVYYRTQAGGTNIISSGVIRF
jgi:hypothetical protein